MALLPYSGLENTPLGTGNPTPINNANWNVLDPLFRVTPRILKTGNIDGKVLATTSLANPLGKDVIVRRITIVPVTFTSVSGNPTLEVGEDIVSTASLAASSTPTLTATQVQELTNANPRPNVLTAGSFKIKVSTAATGTAYLFQLWIEVVFKN